MFMTMISVKSKLHKSMKRIFSNVMLFAAAATAFFSCQKPEVIVPETSQEVTLTFASEKPAFDDETKTEWNGKTIQWSEGDKIAIAYTCNEKWMGQKNEQTQELSAPKLYKSEPLAIETETAKFNVSASFNIQNEGNHVFYGVYPAPSSTSFDDAPSASLTVPALQTPKANSFDGAADLMTGVSVDAFNSLADAKAENISMKWTRLVAHANITLKALNGVTAGERVTSISLTAQEGANLVGQQKVNLLTNEVANDNEASNVLELNGGNLSIDANGNVEFWACVLPETLTSLTVVVETDKATYTREITGISKTFMQNARNTLSIKMDSATREAKDVVSWVLVTSEEELTEGTYVIVVKNTNTKNLTGALDSSNGSSAAPALNTSVQVEDNLLTGVGSSVQFDMTIVDGGYKFAVSGQSTNYLYTTNANNGVRIGTNANNVWTLTSDSDFPDAYTFMCNETNRYMGVYETTPDWRCYTSINENIKERNSEIYLYKKVEGEVSPDRTPKIVVSGDTTKDVVFGGETVTFNYELKNLEAEELTWEVSDSDMITSVSAEDGVLTVNVAENDGEERTATITLSCGDANDVVLTINQGAYVDPESLSKGIAAIKSAATSTTESEFVVTLTDAVVTYVSGSNAYIEDAEAGILVYKSGHGLQVGDKLNGEVSGKVKLYSNLREITAIDYTKASKTEGADVPVTVLTLEQLNADGAYDKYENMRIKIVDATVSAEKQISQGGQTYALYFKNNAVTGFDVDNIIDVIGYPSKYNSAIQLNVWENAVVKGAANTTISGVSDVTVEVGATKVINAAASSGAKVSYVSANTGVATVDDNGTVTGVAEGETIITVSVPAYNGYPAAEETCKVTVKAAGGNEPVETITVSKSIKDISGTTTNGTKVSTLIIDDFITASASTAGNNGKVYNTGAEWRLYQSDNGTVTISAKDGSVINSVKLTYNVSNTGTLMNGNTQIKSAVSYDVKAASVTYSVGNTGAATNGQVRVTAIEVVYQKN